MQLALLRRRVAGIDGDEDTTPLWGILLIALSATFFVVNAFTLVGVKLLPGPTGHPVVDFFRLDHYYSLLLPMCVPVTLLAVYLNWLSMKFFRHN